jgi:hypothetical protein
MSKKLSREEITNKASNIHKKYDYSLVKYNSMHTKIKIICPEHGIFEQTPAKHINAKQGCPKCANNTQPTISEFINKANKTHNNKYIYSNVNYINAHTKIEIICCVDGHGIFEQTPCNHLNGAGCPKCNNRLTMSAEKANLLTQNFIKQANKIHNYRYDYSPTKFTNSSTPVEIICNTHGLFTQLPSGHLSGRGCKKCYESSFISEIIFKEKASIIHNNKYCYNKVKFINLVTKVIITCTNKEHGDFDQTPTDHLSGRGCPKCVGKNKTTEEFIKQAKVVHGNLYTYLNTIYIKSSTKIKIICNKRGHGEFEQSPSDHLQGHGCPKCSSSISLPEIIWLNINQVKPEFRQYKILNYTVDGYDPNTNTVYEFHGDYWHGNPNKFNQNVINKTTKTTFGELYEKTLQKEQHLKTAGYNLIIIWDSEFKEQYAKQIKKYKLKYGTQKIIEQQDYQ